MNDEDNFDDWLDNDKNAQNLVKNLIGSFLF